MPALNRRDAIKLSGGLWLAACSNGRVGSQSQPIDHAADSGSTSAMSKSIPRQSEGASPSEESATSSLPAKEALQSRRIPKSGEAIPVIGLGTWQTFDVVNEAAARAPLREVMAAFLSAGARLIDSSPMYGQAEEATGDVLAQLPAMPRPFLATKVWTTGKAAGIHEMNRSLQRMRTTQMDLLQVHNLVDCATHLPTLRAWREQGKVRYIGVTHYLPSEFPAIETLMRQEALDFVQIPYSLAQRGAEARLLPLARDTQTAVIVMTPFESGRLFSHVKGRELPPWARDFDCQSWAQFFLKFILGHPAVTCPIPATANPKHVADNLQAGLGRLPDEATRRKMIDYLGL